MNPWDEITGAKKEPSPWDEIVKPKEHNALGLASIGKATMSAIPSTLNLAGQYADAVLHPIDTAQGLADIAGGALGKVLPDALRTENPERNARQDAAFNGLIDHYKLYGQEGYLKNKFENDPAGIVSDIQTIVAPFSPKRAAAIDPVFNALGVAKSAIKPAGRGVANLLGTIGTHTGGVSLQKAAEAGIVGGSKGADFLDNISENVPATDVVRDAFKGYEGLSKKGFQDYLNNTRQSFNDLTPLSYEAINRAMNTANQMDVHNGIDINPGTAPTKSAMQSLLDEFKDAIPSPTIKDLDALKRGIGNIRKNTDPSKTERRAADNVYGSIKDAIVDQSPEYGTAMKASEEALAQLTELQRELSLNPKANIGTTLRKLQSTTRNNAYTSYGHRVSLADMLEQNGAENLSTKLAGQALNTIGSRGFGGVTMPAGLLAGYASGNMPLALLSTALQSPKLMGYSAYGVGKTYGAASKAGGLLSGALNDLGISPAMLANYASKNGLVGNQDKQ